MARTVVGVNDPKAVKRYAGVMAADIAKQSYFLPRFIGEGEPSLLPIQRLTELESDAGESISFDISMQLTQEPIEGDNRQEGTEEDLQFYSDTIYIDQMRCGASGGGRMTRKRTLNKMRDTAKARMADWWARIFDEVVFIYLSGVAGTATANQQRLNPGFVLKPTWNGRANNSIMAPDATHKMSANAINAANSAAFATTDKMSLSVIDRFVAKAGTMGGNGVGSPRIQPIKINGETRFVCVMHKWSEYDLRTGATSGTWLDIQKALATSIGKASPICLGGMGEYSNVVLHAHENVIRMNFKNDYSVPGARNLFLGVQAAVVAFGSPGTGLRYDWYEETRDNGNELVISSSSIFGCKKTTFGGSDFGVVVADCAAADPG